MAKYKAILCYVKKPKRIERVTRHFLSSLLIQEELGVISEETLKELLPQHEYERLKGKSRYVVRDLDAIKNILAEFHYILEEDKIIVEIVLTKVEEGEKLN